jgi:hypothetical protein
VLSAAAASVLHGLLPAGPPVVLFFVFIYGLAPKEWVLVEGHAACAVCSVPLKQLNWYLVSMGALSQSPKASNRYSLRQARPALGRCRGTRQAGRQAGIDLTSGRRQSGRPSLLHVM